MISMKDYSVYYRYIYIYIFKYLYMYIQNMYITPFPACSKVASISGPCPLAFRENMKTAGYLPPANTKLP